ncbi:MAG: glycosyltransferase [Candidatus Levybacteria bacterium]|nr:glycosyltransferase [Candidatus Levybacteria bacterium]
MKTALVYDRVNKWGGAERVLLALHKLFPDAPLYTSVYDKKKAPWAKVFDVRTSFLQNFPFATRHELYATLMPLAFESFSFDEYDLVISVTSEAAKGIIVKPGTLHICYCLTPTRYLWSAYDDYFKNPYFKFISKPIVSYLRTWDKIAAQRPDAYLAISKEVQGRIKKYYDRESEVVYPPLSEAFSSLASSVQLKTQELNAKILNAKRLPYFLIVSRLVPYKRIDLAISAFNKLKLPLKIVGIGSEEKRLKEMAGQTIEFLGYLTQEELVGYYRGCRALIFPGIEDFGLAILEAQSFGKPVIAFRGGGAIETIIDGKTGLFFDKQSVGSLTQAIKQFNNKTINPEDCINQAQKFNFEQFKKNFMKKVEELSA